MVLTQLTKGNIRLSFQCGFGSVSDSQVGNPGHQVRRRIGQGTVLLCVYLLIAFLYIFLLLLRSFSGKDTLTSCREDGSLRLGPRVSSNLSERWVSGRKKRQPSFDSRSTFVRVETPVNRGKEEGNGRLGLTCFHLPPSSF